MNISSRQLLAFLSVVAALLIGAIILRWDNFAPNHEEELAKMQDSLSSNPPPIGLVSQFPEADFTKSAVDYTQVLSGGPGRDGIPALTDPAFEPLNDSTIDDSVLGIYLKIDDEERFYPYNILVWHEIVNDRINDQAFAVTFCPLCGSAVVFDRVVDGVELEFGVSGHLWQSNMIMYDRSESPSFWSQSIGKSIFGPQTDTELSLLSFQLLDLKTVKDQFPNTQIMSQSTGISRNYTFYPYGDYDNQEELLFPVSVDDNRYPAKEIFYILPATNTRGSIAIRNATLEAGEYDIGDDLTLVKTDLNEITVTGQDNKEIAGYFEMWFSWATHHHETGQVWDHN